MVIDPQWKPPSASMNPGSPVENKHYKLAQLAYAAYGNHVNWKNFQGDAMPYFDDLPIRIQGAWQAAAEMVVKYVTREEAE